jgi:tRNA modification GTPase
VAGTTRDAIWAYVALPRGIVRVVDIAGVEALASGEIGRQVQQTASREIDAADVVVLVHPADDARPEPVLSRPPGLTVRSKSDLSHGRACVCAGEILVSAVTGEGMDALRADLDAKCFGQIRSAAALALNSRHVECVTEAQEALSDAVDASGAGAEIGALHLREALDALGRILGSVTPDDVLGRVFGRFCVGK